MIWSIFPPSVDINTISETLSSLRLYTDKGHAPEDGWPGSSRDRSTWAGKPHGHEKARGQSSTTFYLNPSAGEILADLPTHHTQAIGEVLATTEMTFSTSSDEDDDSWAGADFSRLNDPGALRRFIGVCNYLLDDGDSDNSGYDLTWP
jgi:hypothetical protein